MYSKEDMLRMGSEYNKLCNFIIERANQVRLLYSDYWWDKYDEKRSLIDYEPSQVIEIKEDAITIETKWSCFGESGTDYDNVSIGYFLCENVQEYVEQIVDAEYQKMIRENKEKEEKEKIQKEKEIKEKEEQEYRRYLELREKYENKKG